MLEPSALKFLISLLPGEGQGQPDPILLFFPRKESWAATAVRINWWPGVVQVAAAPGGSGSWKGPLGLGFTEPGFLGGECGVTSLVLPPGSGSLDGGEPGREVEDRAGARKLSCF